MLSTAAGKQDARQIANTVSYDGIVTMPEKEPVKIVHDILNSGDYASQIWPIEEQKRRQREMAERYDELCGILQSRMNIATPPDHNSRAEEIKARLRKKLEAKKNQAQK